MKSTIFHTVIVNGKAPLKSDWYQASSLLEMVSFFEICSFYENRQFSMKKLQMVEHLVGKIWYFSVKSVIPQYVIQSH